MGAEVSDGQAEHGSAYSTSTNQHSFSDGVLELRPVWPGEIPTSRATEMSVAGEQQTRRPWGWEESDW